MNTFPLIRALLIGIAVLMLGGLGGWYFYLRTQGSTLASTDAARGFGAVTPSFTGDIGSSHENSLASLVASSTPVGNATGGNKQLWHVDAVPVAGFGFVTSAASTTALYFVERATGYTYKANPGDGSITRMTSTLTPKVYEAFVATNGSVIQRSLNEGGVVESTLVVGPSASSSVARRVALPRSMSPAVANPDGQLLYGTQSDSGIMTLWSAQWDGTHAKPLFTTPITHWRLFALEASRTVISEQPSNGIMGHAYEILRDGSLAPITKPLQGLTILPQASSSALITSSAVGTSLQLFIAPNSKTAPVLVSLATVAEKCAWAPLARVTKKGALPEPTYAYCAVPDTVPQNYPDAWYRGEVHTTDAWWRINPVSGTTSRVSVDLTAATMPPDVTDIVINSTGTYAAFRDTRDESLWLMKLPL